MKFDSGKAWPHPVLRPSFCGDDYPHAAFEVEIAVERVEGSTTAAVNAEFSLGEPDLLRLVKDDHARYVLLIKAPQTHYRNSLQSAEHTITHQFQPGELSGRVEFAGLLICTRQLTGFASKGWHSDFQGLTFDIAPGSVLAEDTPKEYWIDTADEAPIGSIFGHNTRDNIEDGRWEYELAEERVWIVMSVNDSARYELAKDQANNRPEAQYLINGLYLPVLVAVLNEVDANAEEYQEYRWFSSLNQRLEAVGCKPLGEKGANRAVDAQRIFESPFLKMPIIAEAGR